MVSLMLQSEQIWMLIVSFVTLVMKTRELDGRAERGNNEGQEKSHRGLHPRSCVLGGLGCPRRSGEESYYSGLLFCVFCIKIKRFGLIPE